MDWMNDWHMKGQNSSCRAAKYLSWPFRCSPSACWCPKCEWQALRVPGSCHGPGSQGYNEQSIFQRSVSKTMCTELENPEESSVLSPGSAALCLAGFRAIFKSLWSQRAQNQTNCIQGISFHHSQAPLKAQTDLFQSSGASHSAKYNSGSWFSWEETPQWNFFHNFTSPPKHRDVFEWQLRDSVE